MKQRTLKKTEILRRAAAFLALATMLETGTGLAAGTDAAAENAMPAADTMAAAQTSAADEASSLRVDYITDGVRYSESVFPYRGGLLISNFGVRPDELQKGGQKGFISYLRDGKMTTVVQRGSLHMPTGLTVKGNYLFVCDNPVVKVFKLLPDGDRVAAAGGKPQIVRFPDSDKTVNAVAVDGDTLYVTMTDPGSVFTLNVSDPAHLEGRAPKRWLSVPGANGIKVQDGTVYIASIPPDYIHQKPENVIYEADAANPVLKPVNSVPGRYDGVAVSADGKTLYASDWLTSSVIAINLSDGTGRTIYQRDDIGPADIALDGDTLYVPELLKSDIAVIHLK